VISRFLDWLRFRRAPTMTGVYQGHGVITPHTVHVPLIVGGKVARRLQSADRVDLSPLSSISGRRSPGVSGCIGGRDGFCDCRTRWRDIWHRMRCRHFDLSAASTLVSRRQHRCIGHEGGGGDYPSRSTPPPSTGVKERLDRPDNTSI